MKVDKFRKTSEITEMEVASITRLLGLEKNQTILDLCCGYGRVSTLLGLYGYRVIGLDLSSSLLTEAKKRSHKLMYIRANMSYIPLKNLDAIINVNTSFGYLKHEQNLKTLQCVYEALNHGGKFLLEQRNIYSLNTRRITEEEYMLEDIGLRFTKESSICLVCGVWSGFYEYENLESASKKKYFFNIRLYRVGEIEEMLSIAGFNPKHVYFYGDYDGSTFREKESPRLLVLAEKTL